MSKRRKDSSEEDPEYLPDDEISILSDGDADFCKISGLIVSVIFILC